MRFLFLMLLLGDDGLRIFDGQILPDMHEGMEQGGGDEGQEVHAAYDTPTGKGGLR